MYVRRCTKDGVQAAYHKYLKKNKGQKIPVTPVPVVSYDNIDSPDDFGGLTYTQAREMGETYKAKKAKLDFEKADGKLVEVASVVKEWVDMSESIKSSMLAIPDRVAPMLQGMGHKKIFSILTKEIKHTLTGLRSIIIENAI